MVVKFRSNEVADTVGALELPLDVLVDDLLGDDDDDDDDELHAANVNAATTVSGIASRARLPFR